MCGRRAAYVIDPWLWRVIGNGAEQESVSVREREVDEYCTGVAEWGAGWDGGDEETGGEIVGNLALLYWDV